MIQFEIKGESELAKSLQGIKSTVLKEAAFEAVVQAVQPTVELAKSLAPVASGSLRRSIGLVIRLYKKGMITYGIIGARRGFGTGGNEPANYAHLVEYGHVITSGGAIARVVNPFKPNNRSGVVTGIVEPKPFLRPAWESTKAQVLASIQKLFGRRVEYEVARSKGGKRYSKTVGSFVEFQRTHNSSEDQKAA